MKSPKEPHDKVEPALRVSRICADLCLKSANRSGFGPRLKERIRSASTIKVPLFLAIVAKIKGGFWFLPLSTGRRLMSTLVDRMSIKWGLWEADGRLEYLGFGCR